MMRPLRRGIMLRATVCRQKNTPLALTRMIRSQSPSVRSMMSARRVTPALLTRMSMRPCSAIDAMDHALDVGDATDVGGDRLRAQLALRQRLGGALRQRAVDVDDDHDRAGLRQRSCRRPHRCPGRRQ